MWARLSHILQLLTKLKSIKETLKWTGLEKKLLDEIKHTVNKNTLLAYPYFNKWFGKNRNAN